MRKLNQPNKLPGVFPREGEPCQCSSFFLSVEACCGGCGQLDPEGVGPHVEVYQHVKH